MGKRTRYITVSQDETRVVSGAWAAHPKIDKDDADHVLLATEGSESDPTRVTIARYDFKSDALSSLRTVAPIDEGMQPWKMAVHPGGDGVIVSFEAGCKFFEWEELSGTAIRSTTAIELKLQPSERELGALDDVGHQNCMLFNRDGSLLACGGEDGHIRVVRWPSMEVVCDLPMAAKSINDLDISLDSAYLSITAEKSPCIVWDLRTCEIVTTLEPAKGESFCCCRFSQDAQRAFLFVTITKGKKGLVGVWDLSIWKRLGTKQFYSEPISSMAITHHGRKMALGTAGGDISIIDIKKMQVQQVIKNAHLQSVSWLEFSPNDKALLSLSSDCSVRVSALDMSKEWKEWQLYLVLIGIFAATAMVFYIFYLYGDDFFQLPDGAGKPPRPTIRDPAELGRHQHEEL